MTSVFEMPIEELRERADTVCELCAELLDLVPVLADEPELGADGEERAELVATCDQVVRLVRGSFRRIAELLPGVANLPALGAAEPPPSPEQLDAMRRLLDAQPLDEPPGDSEPSARQRALRRARDAMERRAIFERVAGSVGELLEELRRLKLEVELRIGMPWNPSITEGDGPLN